MALIGFIGSGNMALALIKGIIDKNVYNFSNIWVSDVDSEKLRTLKNQFGINIAENNAQLAAMVDIVVLSVKPQVMDKVLDEIKDSIRKDTIVVSIAAGVRIARIIRYLGNVAIVRVMPNTPALAGFGVAGIYSNPKAQPAIEKVKRIFNAVGQSLILDDESMLDAVTAVSGSGPAYFFLLMEKMIDAAVELGIDSEIARKLVLQTAKGSAELALISNDHPAELRRKVTSPNGTTEAALKVFTEAGLENTLVAGIKRAHSRSVELSE